MQKQQLTKEFHKPIITKFKKKTKVYSPFKDNIMEADVANVKLISKFYKGIRFFYYALLIFIVNIVVPLKYKKSVTITNAFQ